MCCLCLRAYVCPCAGKWWVFSWWYKHCYVLLPAWAVSLLVSHPSSRLRLFPLFPLCSELNKTLCTCLHVWFVLAQPFGSCLWASFSDFNKCFTMVQIFIGLSSWQPLRVCQWVWAAPSSPQAVAKALWVTSLWCFTPRLGWLRGTEGTSKPHTWWRRLMKTEIGNTQEDASIWSPWHHQLDETWKKPKIYSILKKLICQNVWTEASELACPVIE